MPPVLSLDLVGTETTSIYERPGPLLAFGSRYHCVIVMLATPARLLIDLSIAIGKEGKGKCCMQPSILTVHARLWRQLSLNCPN